MNESRKARPNQKRPAISPEKESRTSIIAAVQTPLGFFVLVVLVVEVILGITAGLSSGNDRTYLVIGMLLLIFILVFIVAGMAIFRPMALYGVAMKPQAKVTTARRMENSIAEAETIKSPRILCATTSAYMFYESVVDDYRIISRAFPKSHLKVESLVTGDKLRELLTTNKFDIVQLIVNVSKDGSVHFGLDMIPSEGIVQLLETSNVKLLVLACCNSVPLAAKLANRVNMIAASGELEVQKFNTWQNVFAHV